MMSYLRIIYELALPWCPLKFHEKWEKIIISQKDIEINDYRKYINVRRKKGMEKIKFYLVRKRMEKLLLFLGIISLKWKKEL